MVHSESAPVDVGCCLLMLLRAFCQLITAMLNNENGAQAVGGVVVARTKPSLAPPPVPTWSGTSETVSGPSASSFYYSSFLSFFCCLFLCFFFFLPFSLSYSLRLK
jgi:hypothetical protein